MLETIALAVPTSLILLYLIIGAVEFAFPVLDVAGLLPAGFAKKYFAPVWETTNVFLVMALTAMFTVFAKAEPQIAEGVRGALLLTGGLLATRAILVLASFYGYVRGEWVRNLWAIASLAIPFVLAQVLLFFVMPDAEMSGMVGFWAGLGMVLTVLSIGTVFVACYEREAGKKGLKNLSVVLVACVTAFVIGTILYFSLYLTAIIVAGLGVLALGVNIVSKSWWRFVTVVLVVVAMWVAVFVRQLPYLIYGQVKVSEAVTDTTNLAVIVGSLVVAIVVIVPAFWLLHRLVRGNLEV